MKYQINRSKRYQLTAECLLKYSAVLEVKKRGCLPLSVVQYGYSFEWKLGLGEGCSRCSNDSSYEFVAETVNTHSLRRGSNDILLSPLTCK